MLVCFGENNFSGTSETSVVVDSSSSKCLIDTSRALLLKLGAASLLASVYSASTLFIHAGRGRARTKRWNVTAILDQFIFWVSDCSACWLEALFMGECAYHLVR